MGLILRKNAGKKKEERRKKKSNFDLQDPVRSRYYFQDIFKQPTTLQLLPRRLQTAYFNIYCL